jgi:hypothetical protein
MGPHTQSAGTAEIARRSGGDSMAVDDADALETTLSRIRQRYALHFTVPPGAKAGEERNIEVELSAAARRRYPDADLRYRQSYQVTGGGSSDASPAPAVISRAPAPAAQPGAAGSETDSGGRDSESRDSGWRRRRAADSSGPREGPLDIAGGSSDTRGPDSPPAAPPAAPSQPTASPASQAAPQPPSVPRSGGWRRVDEPAPPKPKQE